jgi:D-lactate dehydrogenase
MKLAVFSTHSYDQDFFSRICSAKYSSTVEIVFHNFSLSTETASLAQGCNAVCVFVNDTLSSPVLEALNGFGVRAILLRCAGYNNVNLAKAEELGLFVANVPAYSPESVAEFAIALLQTLNRKTHRAYNRVREGNFNLDGLVGFTLQGKTVGIIGTGKIGIALARILHGFGCRLLAYDPFPNQEFNRYGEFIELDSLLQQSDIISLHCPLLESTKYIINETSLAKMKPGAILLNTSRGGLVNTKDVIGALKTKKLGGLALDVYEGEGSLFYGDHSGEVIEDDYLMRLTTFPNVIVCGHQAFFTSEALEEIANVTLENMQDFMNDQPCKNSVIRSVRPGSNVTAGSGPVRI